MRPSPVADRPVSGTTSTSRVLPDWLAARESYEPLDDRSSFIEHNLGHIGGALAQIGDPAPVPLASSPVDRLLHPVSPGVRLLGVIALIVCVNATRNMLFSYMMLALVLVMLAVRPARLLKAILAPTLAVCLLSLVVALPAVFVGQTSAPVRLTVRAFISVSLVVSLARTIPWNRLIAGLRGVGCPDALIYICDVTIQFVEVLGRSMVSLLEALKLRSVGRDTTKLTSAGRLMGVLFIRANEQARAMAEAMVCRGFDGTYHVRESPLATWQNGLYALAVAGVIALAVYVG